MMSSRVVSRYVVFVCLMIGSLSGCGPRQFKDWSGDAIVFGNVKIVTADGKDFTKFCEGRQSATDDYVPGKTYSRHQRGLDHDVWIYRFESDGSYFTAAAQNETVHLYLNCTQVLASSLTRETDYQFHIDIGTFTTPDKRAASYFGYLTVHLQNDGTVTTRLDKEDDARLAKVPPSLVEQNLPLVRISMASIGKPTGWTNRTISHMNVLFP